VDECEVAAIARRMQCGGRLGQVLPDDPRVTDLFVAEGQLVMREADGPRLVGELGVLQRARVQGNGARLLTARKGDAALQPPHRRELRVGDGLSHRVRRPANRGGGLGEVVLQQPGFSERRADGELIIPRQRSGSQKGRQ
jgi:hypothetical protein